MKGMKRAIVVGASSGIGREVARLLIADGWSVGLAARRTDELQRLKTETEQQATAHEGATVLVARIDVNSSDAPAQLRELVSRMGGMELFFYAPGIGKVNRQLLADVELSTVQTNVVGFTRMVGEAYRYFADNGGGHIAAISSIAGTKGLGPAPAYSASKAMQATYLQALEQLANSQHLPIRITDIRPGFVDTNLLSGTHYPLMLRPEKVAREIVSAVRRGSHVRIIDWKYRLLTPLWRCLPNWLWRRLPL